MILVRCLGHIGTSLGTQEIRIEGTDLLPTEIVDSLRKLSGKEDPGFSKYNTLMVIEDGEAFVSAGSDRKVRSGERVVLIPFSHGG